MLFSPAWDGQPCSICTSGRASEINAALAKGESCVISKTFSLRISLESL
jgi:hypothetical protein